MQATVDIVTGPPKLTVESGLALRRIVTGLWQMADQERDGAPVDLDAAAEALAAYARDGFDTFDMADHYGSAEIVAGRAARLLAAEGRRPPLIMTKWCPPPGPMTPEVVRAGVERALERLGLDRVDVMQLHWWRYDHPAWLEAMAELSRLREEGLIGWLGVTNFDAAHLRLLVRHGIEVATNQVCFSLLDRRAAGRMSAVCAEFGIKLLAFGTLGGGFLSERWLGVAEPAAVPDWSKMKYRRFIDAAGGWAAFQQLLAVLDGVARKHGASIANVATRWVLDHDAVGAVIVGARLGEREHRADNLKMLALRLDADDRLALDAASAHLAPIPGDCGDEYRRPPFLTASGDLSHHLDSVPKAYAAAAVPARPERLRVDSGSAWEAQAGFSRAVRIGERILVSGTTATDAHGACVCEGDVEGQTVFILDKVAAALAALDASLDDVVRTRIYLTDPDHWQEAARAHARVFGTALPANTLVAVAGLVGPYLVEIEAEAVATAPPIDQRAV
jgi:aryl-alcohol dehydrogenase-like predicted oxidoreductase/enamine deaminase RidA (YjgF/YER057c/UK114 family)